MKAGVKLLVCEQSTQLLRMARGEFVPMTKVAELAHSTTEFLKLMTLYGSK